jgi:SAM-dependent methyltransferase
MLESQLCSAESLRSPALKAWAERLQPLWRTSDDDQRDVMLHRKMWEWLFIAEALRQRGMLTPGRRGLGFGVGQEPLVALFAAEGCDLVATDQPRAAALASGWTDSEAEWAGGLEDLNRHGLCPADEFARRVRFRDVDMNAIPADLRDFDFTWSSCALEHLGTLRAGADFVVNQMDCLKPGGVAVHTTEYLVSKDETTVEAGGTVLYRRRDVEQLAARLRRAGHRIDVDYTLGDTPEDLHVDVPPYSDVHLRTELAGHVTTSLALVITKEPGRRKRLRQIRGGGPS